MYPRPSGPALTADLARELDDSFFTSDPHGYFSGRIALMLRPGPGGSSEVESPLQKRLVTLLTDVGRSVTVPTDRSYELQIAVDALAVRHHAAEALLRLTHALLAPVPQSSGSTWAAVSLGPTGMREVITKTTDLLANDTDAYGTFRGLLIPDDLVEGEMYHRSAVDTYGEWFDFAMYLFRSTKPDINAAHNKFKHGLGARPVDDVLATFSTTGPNDDGTIPLSALSGDATIPFLGGLTVEYLTQGWKKGRVTPPLESTQLNLEPARLLAEATMIAQTYGAMFHVAAHKHFEGREPIDGRANPPYPKLPVGGPLPKHVRGDGIAGVRVPLTAATDGTVPVPLLFHRDGVWQTFQVTGDVTRAQVVDG